MKRLSLRATFLGVFFFLHTSIAAPPLLPFSGVDVLSGQKVEVGSGVKKGTVVVFLSTDCPCSNSHIPELAQLAKDYPEFYFVGVHSNANETLETCKVYFKKANLPFPVIQDQESKLANQFKALKTPHAFVIIPSGDIVYQGGVSNRADFSHSDKRFLRDALQDIQDHKSVRTSQGRTLGCIIKRS